MGLFNRRAETKQELEALRAELNWVRARLDATEAEKQRLSASLGQLGSEQERLTTHVGAVEQQVATVAGSITPAIDNAFVQAASAADVELIQIELARLSGLSSRVQEIRDTVAAQHAGKHGNSLLGEGHRDGPAQFGETRYHSL